MQKVTHITNLYPPYLGGTEIYMQKIAEGLAHNGFESRVLTSDALSSNLGYPFAINSPNVERYTQDSGSNGDVQIKRVPYCYSSNFALKRVEQATLLCLKKIGSHIHPLLEGILQDTIGPKLLKRGLSENTDIIHASSLPDSCIAVGIASAQHHGVPSVIRPAWHIGTHNPKVWIPILESADLILCATDVEQQFYSDQGIDETKLKKIGYGVDFERIQKSQPCDSLNNDRFTVLSMSSSMIKEKGVPQVVQAAEKLPEMKFVIAGPTDPTKTITNHSLPSNCEYIGVVKGRDKYELLNSVDLFALPSKVESFGIVYMEAMSAGLPVITADIPVSRELYSSAGIQVQYDCIEELVRSIKYLNDNESAYHSYSESAITTASQYSWHKIIKRTENLFKKQAELD